MFDHIQHLVEEGHHYQGADDIGEYLYKLIGRGREFQDLLGRVDGDGEQKKPNRPEGRLEQESQPDLLFIGLSDLSAQGTPKTFQERFGGLIL